MDSVCEEAGRDLGFKEMGVSAHAQLILTGRVWREEAPAQACYPTASRDRDVFCPTGPPGPK